MFQASCYKFCEACRQWWDAASVAWATALNCPSKVNKVLLHAFSCRRCGGTWRARSCGRASSPGWPGWRSCRELALLLRVDVVCKAGGGLACFAAHSATIHCRAGCAHHGVPCPIVAAICRCASPSRYIKGSAEAVRSPQGWLSLDAYQDIGRKRCAAGFGDWLHSQSCCLRVCTTAGCLSCGACNALCCSVKRCAHMLPSAQRTQL